MRLTLTRTLAACLALTFVVLAAGDLCHGWSGDPETRAACCKRGVNACTRVSADDCCEQGEQRSNRVLPAAIPQPSADVTVSPLVLDLRPFQTVDQPPLARRHRAHLLNAVFLI